MAFTKTWDETKPAGSRNVSLGDDDIKEHKYAERERQAIDRRRYATEAGETYVGYANQISYVNQASDPTQHGAGGNTYTKAGELYFKDDDANVQALTNVKRTHSTIGHVLVNQTSAPTTFATGCILYAVSGELYVVDASGNAIKVTTSGALSSGNRHMISRGFGLTYKGTGDVYVEPGTLYNNTTQVNTTARTTLTIATAADWLDGSAASVTSGHVYIYVNAAGSIKLEETAPAYADAAGNTVGKLLYHKESTVYWRWVGSVPVDGSGNILKFYNIGDVVLYDSYTQTDLLDGGSANTWTDVDCSALIPATSFLAKVIASNDETGTNDLTLVRKNGSSATGNHLIYFDSQRLTVSRDIPLDSSQIFEYKNNTGGLSLDIGCRGYYNPRN